MRREARCGAALALGLLIVVGFPAAAAGQEWFELYDDGVAALREGNAAEAVGLLRRASEARPEPGRLVPTYGTNFEPTYLPYLRLAEAHLLLDAVDDAVGALAVSSRFGVASDEERAPVEARVQTALAARQPAPAPVPVTPPSPAPVETRAAPSPASVEPDETEPTPSSELDPPSSPPPASRPATSTPPPEPPAPPVTPVDEPAPSAEPEPEGPPAAQPAAAAVLDIVSDPPGAQVFVDDEPVGRTDPETGRLRLTTLSPGRHRVRISADGWQDVIREVDLAQRDLLVDARLVASPAPADPPALPVEAPSRSPMTGGTVAGLLATSLAVVLLVARVLRQRRAHAPVPRTPSTVSDPGTDEVFPRPFGDYSLLGRIGKGGMAAVYEATKDGESVALKRPLAGFVDDDRFRERFLHEAELGHTLHHPNIIRIFDHGRVGDTPYFTMELLRGETLATRLDREGRLELSRGDAHRGADRRSPGLCAQQGRDSPGPEAVEHHGRAGRHREGHGLRGGPGPPRR